MTRLAAERTTHLTQPEIAAEALRQFDVGPTEPSIRSLAAALRVAPTAIYHHFPAQAAIFQAAVELVWNEATMEMIRLVPHPFSSDPIEVLEAAGLATRRAWLAHHRLSRYMAATPEGNQFTSNALGLLGSVFERLGLEGEAAAEAFHSYATFMIGAVLYAAANKTANEQLAAEGRDRRGRFRTAPTELAASHSSERTRLSLDNVTDVAIVDPQRDEELFMTGLRRLIASLTAGGGRPPTAVDLQGRAPH
jgi:AcrR family transcriptional regulator